MVWETADSRRLEAETEVIEEEIHIPELVTYQDNTIAPYVLGVYIDDVESIIAQYDWDVRLATAIFRAESQLEPQAVNKMDNHKVCVGSYGVAQIGCIHFGKYGIDWDNWDDPEVNIRTAYLIYREKGWEPWGAYTDKSYLSYIDSERY